MTSPLGLSIGTTNLVAARVGREPVTRRSVLTLFGHRAPEVGLPSQNPNLDEPGLVLQGFVDRVGDPVPLVAADGSSHRAEQLLVDALRAMVDTVGGPGADDDLVIAIPAYWGPGAVRALDAAVRTDPVLARSGASPRLVPDVVAALTALQADPGLNGRGVVVLVDLGGGGTSLSLGDAERGFATIGETVRYPDFSGAHLDQALLTQVLTRISAAGQPDAALTAAVGALARLRDECRGAKERLSAETATTVTADLPGSRTEIRLTRGELDGLVRESFDGVLDALDGLLQRNGIDRAQLAGVAAVGGGASIPLVRQRLSEWSGTGSVITARPGTDAAAGATMIAARGPQADATTGIAPTVADATTTRLGEPAGAAEVQPLAWSEAAAFDEEPVPYQAENPYALSESDPRPEIEYTASPGELHPGGRPWYRRPQLAVVLGVAVALVAVVGVGYTLTVDSTGTTTTSSPAPVPTTSAAPALLPPPPEPVTTVAPPTEVVTVTAPPPAPPPAPVTTTTTTVPPPTTTATTTTTTTTTAPITTTTTPPTTTTTAPTTPTTAPPMTTTHLNIPFLPPIPIPVPQQAE